MSVAEWKETVKAQEAIIVALEQEVARLEHENAILEAVCKELRAEVRRAEAAYGVVNIRAQQLAKGGHAS